MRRKIYFYLTAIALLFIATDGQGAFFVKKQVPSAITQINTTSNTAPIETATSNEAQAQVPVATPVATKKQSFFSRVWHTLTAPKAAEVPLWAYILLAFIGFGWLAMGINDNFQGFDWLLSLILYFCFVIPGIIYTLIMMGKYY
jgi:hypothetical protein